MNFIERFISRWFIHLDTTLLTVATEMPGHTLFVFFVVIFAETGLVIMPFLPGDSFVFAAGTLAAAGAISPVAGFAVLVIAAILGNALNFFVGFRFGHWVLNHPFVGVRSAHIAKTEAFFEKYGAATIILSRFFPIVRTVAPFLAGMGSMSYGRFMAYNVIGAVLWIVSFYWGGYWLGNVPIVRAHFPELVLGIIVVSFVPALIQFIRRYFR